MSFHSLFGLNLFKHFGQMTVPSGLISPLVAIIALQFGQRFKKGSFSNLIFSSSSSGSQTSLTPPPIDMMVIVILGIGAGGIAIIAIIVIFLKRTPSGGSSETGYSW